MKTTPQTGASGEAEAGAIPGAGRSKQTVEEANRRLYRELLQETPHWHAPLTVEEDEEGDWVIVARLDSRLTHGNHRLEKNTLGEGKYWETREEAQTHLAGHESTLRLELTEDLFTMALCTVCERVVPVFGDYFPYAPAGMLVCGECRSDDDDPDQAGPAIIHP